MEAWAEGDKAELRLWLDRAVGTGSASVTELTMRWTEPQGLGFRHPRGRLRLRG